MEFKPLTSKNIEDYEVVVKRRSETDYSAYCPEINIMVDGTEHEEVELKLKAEIQKHIDSL
jgi:hypothetical protein